MEEMPISCSIWQIKMDIIATSGVEEMLLSNSAEGGSEGMPIPDCGKKSKGHIHGLRQDRLHRGNRFIKRAAFFQENLFKDLLRSCLRLTSLAAV
jgi:hypothetical protein